MISRFIRKKVSQVIIIFLVVWLSFVLLSKPSNERDWEIGMDKLPSVSINESSINIKNIRDFRYDSKKVVSQNYIEKSFDVSKITKVWFLYEPFTVKPLTSFKGVAHTYFVFDFSDQNPVVLSIEARREKGEKYEAFNGIFNNYELLYLWGSEEDETIMRVVNQNNKLYMYPLNISQNGAQELFRELAQATQKLETEPRFYNTFTSNCTNELAKTANKVKANSIPLNLALIFPGYSDKELYKLGFIPNNLSLEDIKAKYYISDIVNKYYKEEGFSSLLRKDLDN